MPSHSSFACRFFFRAVFFVFEGHEHFPSPSPHSSQIRTSFPSMTRTTAFPSHFAQALRAILQAYSSPERLQPWQYGLGYSLGFATRTPPSASLVGGLSARQSVRRGEVVVKVLADAELSGVRAVVQVHAVCATAR